MTESGLKQGLQWAAYGSGKNIQILDTGGTLFEEPHILKLTYRQGAVTYSATDIKIDWNPFKLWQSVVDINRLKIGSLNVEIDTSSAHEVDISNFGVESPSSLNLPFDVVLGQLKISNIAIKRDETHIQINSILASMALNNESLHVGEINIEGNNYTIHLAGNWGADNHWAHDFQLQWQVRLPSGSKVDGNGGLKGQADNSKLNLSSRGYINLDISLDAQNLFEQPDWNLMLDLKPVNTADTGFDIPPVIISAQLNATSDSKKVYAKGQFQADTDKMGILKGDFNLSSSVTDDGFHMASLEDFKLVSDSGQIQATGMVDWQSDLHWNTEMEISNLSVETFFPDWPGAISTLIRSDGHYVDSKFQISANVTELQGELRGFPVKGGAKLKGFNRGISVTDLHLLSGLSKLTVDGEIGESLALNWVLDSEQLSQFHPEAEGNFSIKGLITGRTEWPVLQASFSSDSLHFNKQDLGNLTGRFEFSTSGQSKIETLTGLLEFDSSLIGHFNANYKLNKREVLAEFNGLEFENINIKSEFGNLNGNGLIDWYPELRWQSEFDLAHANPGNFWPEWSSNISGHLESRGSQSNDQLAANIELSDFSGFVKDYPLNLSSQLVWRNNGLDIKALNINSDQTHLVGTGRIDHKLDINWKLDGDNLSNWFESSRGQIKAKGRIMGTYDVPVLESTFSAGLVGYQNLSTDSLDGFLNLKWSDSPDLKFSLNLPQLKFDGHKFTDLKIQADSKRVNAHIESNQAILDVQLRGEFAKTGWNGLITKTTIETQNYGDWHLKSAARLSLRGHQFEIGSTCLIESNSEVCIKGHKLDEGWSAGLQATQISTKLFQSWMPEALSIEGQANATGVFGQLKNKHLSSDMQVDIAPATVVLDLAGEGQKEIHVQSAHVSLQAGPTGIETTSKIVLDDGDHLDADISLPGGDLFNLDNKSQAIKGKINLSLKELELFNPWVPEVENIDGVLDSTLDVFGTIEDPRLKGILNITNAGFFHPDSGIELSAITFRFMADANSRFNYRGSALTSGGKILTLGSGYLNDKGMVKANIEINGVALDIEPLLKIRALEKVNLNGLFDFRSSLLFQSPDNLTGTINFKAQDGFFELPLINGESELWQYQNAGLDLELSANDINGQVLMLIGDNSRISGQFKLPRAKLLTLDVPRQKLKADLEIDFDELGFIEAVVPDVDQLNGSFLFKLGVDGTLGNPGYKIKSQITDASLVIPRLGLSLKNINHSGLTGRDNRFDFNLEVDSGDGTLLVKGHSFLDAKKGWETALNISGSDFEVSDIPEAYVIASPDLNISLKHRLIEIKGDLLIPYARIQPKDITTAAQVSSDTVIIDSSQKTESAWQINSEVNLKLGDRVKFYGFGFEGNVGGELLIEEKAGQPTRGNGEIDLSGGRYLAYGQELDVESGRLLFTGGPITNPGVDVRATRRTGEIIAGVHALGRLNSPKLLLFSVPAMGQTDMLSYLLLGRPMESASGEDNNMVAQAALALSISGGDKIARSIGQRLGFDEMRLEGSETGDQASLVVGRYLSPQLYISYGVGLVGSFNTFALRYRISEQWQLKAESGKVQGADILYTFER
jgi:autotransporter translocation and assembly factor TamB